MIFYAKTTFSSTRNPMEALSNLKTKQGNQIFKQGCQIFIIFEILALM